MPPTRLPRFAALLAFLRTEAAGGALLIGAAVAAIAWANAPAAPLYDAMLALPIGLHAGNAAFALPLHLWVNDGLMALFFLLVGLEIRREMTDGELASWQGIAAPGIAALGGMAVPAAIFVLFNRHNPAVLHGWAVPVATDIAFSLAVLRVLGRRAPVGLKLFLTALAIIDDLGAIVVIALFYTAALNPLMLAGAAGLWIALFLAGRAGLQALWPYVLGGLGMWALVFASGIHATLAGVALAFAVPAPVAARLEAGLERGVAFGVLPLFGLTNAGLGFAGLPTGILRDPLVVGIGAGLVIGKQVGVFGATWAAIRLHLARLPAGVSLRQLYGGAVLCGIGFTMSLFIGDLAFRGGALDAEVKLAVFAGSVISAVWGLAVLARAR